MSGHHGHPNQSGPGPSGHPGQSGKLSQSGHSGQSGLVTPVCVVTLVSICIICTLYNFQFYPAHLCTDFRSCFRLKLPPNNFAIVKKKHIRFGRDRLSMIACRLYALAAATRHDLSASTGVVS